MIKSAAMPVRVVKRVFAIGDWTMRYYPPAQKYKLDSPWLGPYLVVALAAWDVGVQLHSDSPVLIIHCQDLNKIPRPRGLVPWWQSDRPDPAITQPVLGTSMACQSTPGSAPSTVSGILSHAISSSEFGCRSAGPSTEGFCLR